MPAPIARRERAVAPRRTPKQPRAEETRQRILEAAAHVFAVRGYAGGTTNHIAAEAGLSIGSLYQYFPNKDAILVELSRAHARAGFEDLRVRLAGGLPEGLEARLRLFVDAVLANHTDDHRLHQVLFEEAPRPAVLLAELHEFEAQAIAAAEALLAEDPEVHVADVGMAARMVVTAIESLIHRFIARDGATLDATVFTDELVAMLLRYLRG